MHRPRGRTPPRSTALEQACGSHSRSGIQLIPLTRDQEEFIREDVAMVISPALFRDTEAIIAMIMRSLDRKHRQHGYSVFAAPDRTGEPENALPTTSHLW